MRQVKQDDRHHTHTHTHAQPKHSEREKLMASEYVSAATFFIYFGWCVLVHVSKPFLLACIFLRSTLSRHKNQHL